jgi:hypothetical protein
MDNSDVGCRQYKEGQMNINLGIDGNKKLHLKQNEMLQFRKFTPGTQLYCEKGVLWITQSGDFRDYFLTPGNNLVFKKHGCILMEALSDVEFKFADHTEANLN